MNTDDQKFRFECLKLAAAIRGSARETVVQRAAVFYNFVMSQQEENDSAETLEQDAEEKSPEERQYLGEEAGQEVGQVPGPRDRSQPSTSSGEDTPSGKKYRRDYGAGG